MNFLLTRKINYYSTVVLYFSNLILNFSDVFSTTTEPYYDPRVDMIQNDSNCIDDFPNCHLVVKAKLCDYKYYLDHCCSSCRIKPNDLY